MKCPVCGTVSYFEFSVCPCCGHSFALDPEQPLPNWRKLPGFRTQTPWKMLLASFVYIILLLAILASSFLILSPG
ncbi:hypothetical protein SAMN02745170_03211 [Propionispora hippei DSM 15287]|uniref:Uncharacterized protein n=1 Tax=Propionispora hippei DSM 15287 TaxID=1123003 RepID=A0A1M6LRK4_9FIRM|nr:hypothetical protein SAMN02745170_03211 [Propionispora hippei DSM 15287]